MTGDSEVRSGNDRLRRVLIEWWWQDGPISDADGIQAAQEDMADLLAHLERYGYEIVPVQDSGRSGGSDAAV